MATIAELYQQILGRAPESQAVIDAWTQQFGSVIDPSEVAMFQQAAAPELAVSQYSAPLSTLATGQATPEQNAAMIAANNTANTGPQTTLAQIDAQMDAIRQQVADARYDENRTLVNRLQPVLQALNVERMQVASQVDPATLSPQEQLRLFSDLQVLADPGSENPQDYQRYLALGGDAALQNLAQFPGVAAAIESGNDENILSQVWNAAESGGFTTALPMAVLGAYGLSSLAGGGGVAGSAAASGGSVGDMAAMYQAAYPSLTAAEAMTAAESAYAGGMTAGNLAGIMTSSGYLTAAQIAAATGGSGVTGTTLAEGWNQSPVDGLPNGGGMTNLPPVPPGADPFYVPPGTGVEGVAPGWTMPDGTPYVPTQTTPWTPTTPGGTTTPPGTPAPPGGTPTTPGGTPTTPTIPGGTPTVPPFNWSDPSTYPWGNILGTAAGVGASLYGANLASDSAAEAARIQAQASADALAEEKRQFDLGQAAQMPWRTAGETALNSQVDLMGLGSQGAEGQLASLMSSPGYQFRLDEGQRALDRSASAKGGLFSGAAGRALTEYGQNYATNEYGNRLSQLSSLSGQGQSAASNQAAYGQNYAGNVSNLLTGGANAQAASSIAQGQANQAGILGAGTALSNLFNPPRQQTLADLLRG